MARACDLEKISTADRQQRGRRVVPDPDIADIRYRKSRSTHRLVGYAEDVVDAIDAHGPCAGAVLDTKLNVVGQSRGKCMQLRCRTHRADTDVAAGTDGETVCRRPR